MGPKLCSSENIKVGMKRHKPVFDYRKADLFLRKVEQQFGREFIEEGLQQNRLIHRLKNAIREQITGLSLRSRM